MEKVKNIIPYLFNLVSFAAFPWFSRKMLVLREGGSPWWLFLTTFIFFAVIILNIKFFSDSQKEKLNIKRKNLIMKSLLLFSSVAGIFHMMMFAENIDNSVFFDKYTGESSIIILFLVYTLVFAALLIYVMYFAYKHIDLDKNQQNISLNFPKKFIFFQILFYFFNSLLLIFINGHLFTYFQGKNSIEHTLILKLFFTLLVYPFFFLISGFPYVMQLNNNNSKKEKIMMHLGIFYMVWSMDLF